MAGSPEPRPRITPLPRREWGPDEIAALDPMIPPVGSVYAERRKERGGAGGVNALALMLRNPALCRAFLEFNRHLLYESAIDERTVSSSCCGCRGRCAPPTSGPSMRLSPGSSG
ncbi:MAG: hypothetical protein R2695_18440 [Acidimicrobiales bacterium]